MQMFSESKLCRQSIELFWHAVIQVEFPAYALSMSYKIVKLDKQPFYKNDFFLHVFMHMLNTSALYMQSIRKVQ